MSKRQACPRARTCMTPCVEADGLVAADDDGACVGCGFYAPVTTWLLTHSPEEDYREADA